jgi:undecaprenyl-diphosphatase
LCLKIQLRYRPVSGKDSNEIDGMWLKASTFFTVAKSLRIHQGGVVMSPGFDVRTDSDRRQLLRRFTWIATIVLLLGTLAFLGIADEVMEGDTQRLDQRILSAMRVPGNPAQPIGPAWVEESFRDFTGLGGFGVLSLLTAATVGYLWLQGKRRAAVHLLIAIGGGLLVSLALKAGFHRPRPDLIAQGAMVYTSSFPSGHSMLSAIVYLTGGAMLALLHERRKVRVYILGCAMLATALVGISRVYLGVHWPTDVLAGWAGGAAWAALCWLFAQHFHSRTR